jgi:nitroreductase
MTTSPADQLTPDQLLARLRWRYATKRFDPAAKLDAATWSTLEQALLLAPSSYGLQPWRFVVVKDPAVRARLRAVSRDQPQVVEASHLVVLAYRKGLTAADVRRHVERVAAVRAKPPASLAAYERIVTAHVERPAPFSVDEWAKRQVYLALGAFLTSAAVLGVDACPMEGIEPAEYDALLGLALEGHATVCAAAAGRRAADDAYATLAKVRYPAEAVIRRV